MARSQGKDLDGRLLTRARTGILGVAEMPCQCKDAKLLR